MGSAQPWPEPPAPPPAQAPPLRHGCFYLLVLVPIACALLQLLWEHCCAGGQCILFTCHQREASFLADKDFTYFELQ